MAVEFCGSSCSGWSGNPPAEDSDFEFEYFHDDPFPTIEGVKNAINDLF